MPGKRLWLYPSAKALQTYAIFTAACMEQSVPDRKRLYRLSYVLGNRIRRITGLTQNNDLQRLIFFLYRNIGICMCGAIPGEIHVTKCFFSRFYTPEQCMWIEAMDAGIVTGICGGGNLWFSQRITEGHTCCKACLRKVVQDE